MMQSRTHNCGELRLADAGKAVTIVGWMENVREVGSNFAFVVLRDFYGTTQVVIETEDRRTILLSFCFLTGGKSLTFFALCEIMSRLNTRHKRGHNI